MYAPAIVHQAMKHLDSFDTATLEKMEAAMLIVYSAEEILKKEYVRDSSDPTLMPLGYPLKDLTMVFRLTSTKK